MLNGVPAPTTSTVGESNVICLEHVYVPTGGGLGLIRVSQFALISQSTADWGLARAHTPRIRPLLQQALMWSVHKYVFDCKHNTSHRTCSRTQHIWQTNFALISLWGLSSPGLFVHHCGQHQLATHSFAIKDTH
jgi:hypothetical protein